MNTQTNRAIPMSGYPPTPGLDREEPEFNSEQDIPTPENADEHATAANQQASRDVEDGGFEDTDAVAPEDQSDG